MKRFLALFLSVLMMCSAVPFTASAATVKAPAKPTGVTVSSTVSTVTLKWKKVSAAKGYTVYKYNSKTKKSSAALSTTKTNAKIKKLKAGTTYVYYVKAYKLKKVKKKTQKVYSKSSAKITVSTLPSAVKGLKKTSANFTSVTLSWSKVANASGYKIKYTTDKAFKKGVKTVSTKSTKKTISSLTANKTYYFKIYSYRTIKVNSKSKTYTSAASSAVSAKTLDTSKLTTVTESTKYQTIDGFGASAAWWAHKVGGWENAKDIIGYLYDDNKGIGLNIYRYNLGTDSRSDEEIYNYWQRTEGFLDSVDIQRDSSGNISSFKNTYNWSKDAEAQKALEIAKSYAGKDLKLVLFSNSAPTQLTINGKAYCSYAGKDANNKDWKINLSRENYPVFAKFITDCADHFVEEGYNVVDVSPVNEPQYQWAEWQNDDGTYSMNQEGCHYTATQLKSLYRTMATAAKGKPYKISMFESGAAEGEFKDNGKQTDFSSYLDTIMSDSVNKSYYDTVSTHSYWSDKSTKQNCRTYINNSYPGKKIACTEYCQMTEDTNTGIFELLKSLQGIDRNGMTIDFGVQMARTIYEDLTVLNATQWNWWTACSNGIYTDGLVYINDENHSDIKTSKRLWCLGNFSKFIKAGAKRVKITNTQSKLLNCAFKNPDGSLVIVYINQTNSNLSTNINASGYKSYKTYVTSKTKNLALNQSGTYKITNSISTPANSVTTVVLTK